MPLFPSPEPKVSCFDDLDFFKDFENEFPAIVYNDALTSKLDYLIEPTLSPQHIDEFDLKDETSLSEYDEVEQNILYFNDLFHFNIIYPYNLKSDKDKDDNEIDIIQYSGIMKVGLQERIRRIRQTPIRHMALSPRDQRHQYLRFEGLQYTDTNIVDFEERLGRIYDRELGEVRHRMSWREFDLGMGLHTAKEIESIRFGISTAGDFLSTTSSYTSFRDPMLRLCHRLIACSIVRRSQAPKKVTVTNLFYLRGMDVGSVNIPYILARYLRLFASGRKHEEMIFGGQFVTCLAKHFGLLTKERL
ncbi:hypothetical protein Tco_0308343 [Tanacetum coccineum]